MGAKDEDNQQTGERILKPSENGLKTNGHNVDGRSRVDVWNGPLVLSLDGGGVRGVASLFILLKLMQEIANIERGLKPPAYSSDASPLFQIEGESVGEAAVSAADQYAEYDNYLPCHYFDYICGTSSGGIAAIFLGTMRLPVRETILRTRTIWSGTYSSLSRLITLSRLDRPFPNISRSKNSSRLERQLSDQIQDVCDQSDYENSQDLNSGAFQGLGKNTIMRASAGTCQTFVFAMQSVAKGVQRPFAIRSYSHARSSYPHIRNPECETTDIRILDACRATSATPKYFDKVKIEGHGSFLDGSLWRVNPTEEVYWEIQDLHDADTNPIGALLSVGHQKPRKREFTSNPQRTLSNLVDLPEDGNVDSQVRQKSLDRFKYDRLACPTRSDLGSGSVEKWFARLHSDAQYYLGSEEIQSRIRDWAQFLVDTRRRRARTVRWQKYADLRTDIGRMPAGSRFILSESTKGKQDSFEMTRITIV